MKFADYYRKYGTWPAIVAAIVKGVFKISRKGKAAVTGIPYATQYVEGAASIQLVCPHCGDTQLHTVVMVMGGEEIYTCGPTYNGAGCGKTFRGPP